MKIAITGKGGAGKTTLSVYIARFIAEQSRDVYLIDADPDANAALALGLNNSEGPLSLADLNDVIKERTGAESGYGGFFTLNPRVDDIPGKYSIDVDGVRLLRTGRLKKGGSGCFCPENAFLSSVVSHMFFGSNAWVILDMEAGIEHLGRATAQGVDAMLVVVEPGKRSIQTAHDVAGLADDIGVSQVGAVINKVRGTEAEEIKELLQPVPVLAQIPYEDDVFRADMRGECAYKGTETQREIVADLINKMESLNK